MSTRLAAFAVLAASSVALAQVEIHPGGYSDDKCLDVQGAVFANGTPVQLYVLLHHQGVDADIDRYGAAMTVTVARRNNGRSNPVTQQSD